MPIAREHRWLYPIDWRELSTLVRFGRAQEGCVGRPRPRTSRGRNRAFPAPARQRLATTRVVLASAHLNHDLGNNRLRNLAALC